MSLPVWTPAYIGLSSNLDDPRAQVLRGFDALSKLPNSRLTMRSRLYRTAPMGPQDQPDYVNAVAGMLTQLDGQSLLTELKSLEKKLGRDEPVVRWGPRRIDFDLLVLGSERIATDNLTVPHSGIADRAFVLVPLAEVAPHLEIPGKGRVISLVKNVDASSVVAL